MTTFDMAAVMLLIAAAIGIANERTLRLPAPVALLLGSLFVLGVIVCIDILLHHPLREHLRQRMAQAHLSQVLLDGLIALLLFAGSLEVDLQALRRRAAVVVVLSTGSVVIAAMAFGAGLWAVLELCGFAVPLVWCLVIGAILAPTDAVAVEGLLSSIALPPGLRPLIAGESLFNDGAAVVLFAVALALVGGQTDMIGHGRIALAILVQGGGGALLGAVVGYAGFLLIRLTREDTLATTISLAVALSVYRAAVLIDVSGPIAVVITGLTLGVLLAHTPASGKAHRALMTFWPLVDDTLNTLLYMLIGFEVLVIEPSWDATVAALVAIPVALLARLVSVGGPLALMRVPHAMRATGILTWAGLRGGISIALALILPPSPYRNLLITVCFAVTLFSVIVQGLLLPRVVRAIAGAAQEEPSTAQA